MQVRVKTPHTKVTIEGAISGKLLKVLKEDFGDKLIIEDDGYELAENMDWYKKVSAKMSPGDHMRVFRETRMMTQDKLGKKLGGISRHHISDMENGRRSIGKDAAKKLAEIFGTSVEKFL